MVIGPLHVRPHKMYFSTGYVASLFASSPPELALEANGEQIGPSLPLDGTVGKWTKFVVAWNSGPNDNASFAIVDQNTESYGNDFTLDDLSVATNPLYVSHQQPQKGIGAMFGDANVGAGLIAVAVGLAILGVGLVVFGVAIMRLAAATRRSN